MTNVDAAVKRRLDFTAGGPEREGGGEIVHFADQGIMETQAPTSSAADT